MPITLPSFVAPNELIQSAWGNSVVNALDELDDEKANLAGDDFTGTVTINRGTTGIPLILKQGNETPSLQFQSQAGTVLAQLTASATFLSVDTLSNNPFLVAAPTQIETGSGSAVLTLKAVTETPVLDLQSTAGTSLFKLTAGVATSTIDAFDDMKLRTNSIDAVTIDGGTQNVTMAGGLTVATALTMNGALDHNGTTVGFYGGAPIAKQTGVAVTAAGVHAALVNLGLIT